MKTKEIKAAPNYQKKTFTIVVIYEDGEKYKFRTVKQSKEDFNELLYNTPEDWINYLKRNEILRIK